MTTRERYLAIAVGTIVGLVVLQFGISTVTNSFDAKQKRIETAERANEDKQKTVSSGLRAVARIKELKPRSLPNSQQIAQAVYRDWLVKAGQDSGFSNVVVGQSISSMRRAEGYSTYQFTMIGVCNMEQLLDFLCTYYDKNYLHSLKSLKVTQLQNNPGAVEVNLTSEAIALKIADADQAASEEPSGRLSKTPAEYLSVIGGRNPFAPPNNPPSFVSKNSDRLERGKEWSLQLDAKDKDAWQKVRYELLSDKVDGLLLDSSGKLSFKAMANGEFELLVKAIDSGLPAKSSEQKIKLTVVDPVVPPPPQPPPPKFDVASQTEITGLLSGRDGAIALIRSKVDNKLIEVREGDNFEIGSIKAKVISLNMKEDFIELETDGRRWTVGMDTSLAEAFKKSQID